MTAPSWSIVVFCEGPTDAEVASVLTRRVLVDLVGHGEWLQPEMLEFRGLEPGTDFCVWASLARTRPGPRRTKYGFREGDEWGPESLAAWNALCAVAQAPIEGQRAVLLLRDADSSRVEPDRAALRRRQLRAGVEAYARVYEALPVALGIADPKVECWVLVSFEPNAPPIAEVRAQRELSFNPVRNAHELRGGPDSKTDAKAVLDAVLERTRWEEQLHSVPLATLAARGEQTGLTDFLRGVRIGLGPLVVPRLPACEWCPGNAVVSPSQ